MCSVVWPPAVDSCTSPAPTDAPLPTVTVPVKLAPQTSITSPEARSVMVSVPVSVVDT